MYKLHKYLSDEKNIPQGLFEQLTPFFADSAEDHKTILNKMRDFLERLLKHLSLLAGIQIREVASIIDKLRSSGIIDHQIAPYFHFWWNVSCLGSHFQAETSPPISWEKHLESCRHAFALCILWYLRKYPPLNLTKNERQVWLDDSAPLVTVPFDDIELCREDFLRNHLDTTNVLVLYGNPWIGKTSIANYFTTFLCNENYIPLVIHENSLVTFRILPQHKDDESPKNLKLARNAQIIHEIISTRLLHGESFIVFLDDPFGHRKFLQQNPLMYVPLSKWLELSSQPQTLGSLKVVITTPIAFLKEGRDALKNNGNTNPIAKDNLSLLNEKNCILLNVADYNEPQVRRIVKSAANYHECTWSNQEEYCELIAETLKNNHLCFDALHVLCRISKTSSEDEFLGNVIEVAASANVLEEINRSYDYVKKRLCAAYVGEALIECYRDFTFQTHLSFDDICKAAKLVEVKDLDHPIESIADWLHDDSVSTFNLSHFPVFLHPEVRTAVATIAETTMKNTVCSIISNLCGLSNDYSGRVLSQWEAVHLICRFAGTLSEDDSKIVNEQFFFRSTNMGGDPRNVLWAIIGNWNFIRGTSLEKYASGFSKNIPKSFKWLTRYFIWEVVSNWSHVSNNIRFQILLITGKGDSIESIKPMINEHNTISFLAAGITHYCVIQECASAGCECSEKYLDFINSFIVQIAKSKKETFFSSRAGDGLFDTPGSRYSGSDVLEKLKYLGLKYGSFDENHPLIRQINTLMS
jgi:hypothetical protein